jgi:hypothetical protein
MLELSTRARNVLSKLGAETWSEVAQLREVDIRAQKAIGDVTIREIRDGLKKRGMRFRDDESLPELKPVSLLEVKEPEKLEMPPGRVEVPRHRSHIAAPGHVTEAARIIMDALRDYEPETAVRCLRAVLALYGEN